MRILFLILIFCEFSFSKGIVVNDRDRINWFIDSLVFSFSKYFDEPMSFCDVDVVGGDVYRVDESYGKFLLKVRVRCDYGEFDEYFYDVIKRCFGEFDSVSGGWSGLFGDVDILSRFITRFERRYPWFKVKYNPNMFNFYIIPSDDYGGSLKLNPIWFKVLVNGVVLRDEYVHGLDGNIVDSIVVVHAGYLPGEVVLIKSDVTRVVESIFENDYIVQFKLKNGDIDVLLSGVDIRLVRVYKFKTTGYFNRPYYFPLVDGGIN